MTIVCNSALVAFEHNRAGGHTTEQIIAAAKTASALRNAVDARYRSALLALAKTAHLSGTVHRRFANAGITGLFASLTARDRWQEVHGMELPEHAGERFTHANVTYFGASAARQRRLAQLRSL